MQPVPDVRNQLSNAIFYDDCAWMMHDTLCKIRDVGKSSNGSSSNGNSSTVFMDKVLIFKIKKLELYPLDKVLILSIFYMDKVLIFQNTKYMDFWPFLSIPVNFSQGELSISNTTLVITMNLIVNITLLGVYSIYIYMGQFL